MWEEVEYELLLHLFSAIMAAQNVSFTIRRPTPVSREESATPNFRVPPVPSRLASQVTLDSPLSRSPSASPARPAPDPDSSDAESTEADELVTGFDKFGVQRCVAPPLPPTVVSTHSSPPAPRAPSGPPPPPPS